MTNKLWFDYLTLYYIYIEILSYCCTVTSIIANRWIPSVNRNVVLRFATTDFHQTVCDFVPAIYSIEGALLLVSI